MTPFAVADTIDEQRLTELAYELVQIPSPTGASDAVAARYAERLAEAGLEVRVEPVVPGGPSVIGRLRGSGDGPTLSFVGHLDTIHADHAPPALTADAVYGRGSDDMKGAMAAVVEAVGAICRAGLRHRGDIVVAAHSMHEAPVGHQEGLRALVRSGVLGDAAICAEALPPRQFIVAGKGLAVFEITIEREGPVLHENYAAPETPNPITIALDLANRLRERGRELAAIEIPYLGPETVFIGELNGGVFFNCIPVTAKIVGTRRFGPDREWAEIEQEFDAIIAPVQAETSARIRVSLQTNGLGYRIEPDSPLARAVQRAHQAVAGHTLSFTGTKSVTDANIIVGEGGIPCISYGADGNTGHSSNEFVRRADLLRAARVFTLSALDFVGVD